MAKKRLVIANWKMYVESPDEAKAFVATLKRKVKALPGIDAWVAPPYTMLASLAAATKGSPVKVGAQGVSTHGSFDSAQDKAHTGEVSAAMVKAAGATFSIIGHSEQRAHGTTNEQARAQLVAAQDAGLVPVLCVGELERLPQSGDRIDHFSFVQEQLASALRQGPIAKLVVAYEPVWAIGKSATEAMQPAEVEEMVIYIRKTLAEYLGRDAAHKAVVLYGGSVEAENADMLVKHGGVNGFLVGHASATIDSFLDILLACKK